MPYISESEYRELKDKDKYRCPECRSTNTKYKYTANYIDHNDYSPNYYECSDCGEEFIIWEF